MFVENACGLLNKGDGYRRPCNFSYSMAHSDLNSARGALKSSCDNLPGLGLDLF